MARTVALAVVFAVTAALPAPVWASELPEDEAQATDAGVNRADARLQVTKNAGTSKALWVWSRGRRGYYLTLHSSGYLRIAAVDLDTGEAAGQQDLVHRAYDSPYWDSSGPKTRGQGTERSIAVDEEGGRLFVATQLKAITSAPGGATEYPNNVATRVPGAARGSACAQAATLQCLTGVSVLDATTMEHLRHIPVRSIQADGGAASTQLIAMAYAPPFEGMGGKVLLLVQDMTHAPSPVNLQNRYNPRHVMNATYAIQLDPDTGQQDWVVRLDSCRGTRAGRTGAELLDTIGLGHEGAIFRSRLPGDRAVYVACNAVSSSLTGAVVRVPLGEGGNPGVTNIPAPAAEFDEDSVEAPGPDAVSRGFERPYTVEGPDNVYAMMADPDSGRFLLQVMDGSPMAQVWWVFDTSVMQFVGTIGIGGPLTFRHSIAGVAPNGRLYVLTRQTTNRQRRFEGGLFVADIRRTPVPQALRFPELEASFLEWPTKESGEDDDDYFRPSLVPEERPEGGMRLWVPDRLSMTHNAYVAIDDIRPLDPDPLAIDYSGRTLDLPELDGVTSTVFDGAARGYGFRALLVGGAEAAGRAGPVDPVGTVAQCNDGQLAEQGADGTAVGTVNLTVDLLQGDQEPGKQNYEGPCQNIETPLPLTCLQGNREIVLASVGPEGPSVVDAAGARGAAEPFSIDSLSLADAETPVSRCTHADWEQLWGTALFGRPPADEPRTGAASMAPMAECLSTAESPTMRVGDPVGHGYAAQVTCDDEEASGYAYARGFTIDGASVAEALSSFRIYLDPGRGVVARVESVARGIALEGAVRIDTVRGVAESWANGRAQPFPADEREEGYDPNCDVERTAGTCFTRHLFGLWTPGYSCGPCGDEHAFIQAMNGALNPGALVRMRDPDQRLRIGADNGFAAAIQKAEHERFADLTLNNDLLQTVLPTLEFIRFAAPNRTMSRQGARGRQIYQFAGVEVSSSYGIQCLLVYDEEAGTCGAPAEVPGSIVVSLQDGGGEPLAGGGFELRQDVDADGVLGLVDTLVADGACVTADDGVGTCRFEDLQPGAYLVSQVAAPPGYAKSEEPWLSEVASGEERTVVFTNVSNVSMIELSAEDADGAALSGAAFAAYPDPDADGKVAPEAEPAASCTTDESGSCTMSVPAGSYVLVQTGAPGGLEGIEPVPFTFASGGQVAAVTVTNYPPESVVDAPPPAASPVYSPPVGVAPPMESVTDFEPVPTVDEPAPSVSVPERIGGTVVQVIRAPGDALRLLSRDPKQAAAWMGALALFALAVLAVRRRQQAMALLDG